MSYSDSRSFMSSGSDAIDVCTQFPMNTNEQFDPISQFENQMPPFKRPRSSDDFRRLSLPNTPNPINRRTTNIFYKTRICPQLKTGSCRNGESCTYAHGIQELRQPPPNWQEIVGGQIGEEDNRSGFGGNWDDDQRIISKMKLCKKFCNGEGCPYGDRCNFVHEYPSKFRDDVGKFRESSAISIGTSGQPNAELGSVETNKALNSANSDVFRANMKVYWKTKLCVKWDTTGHCPFGDKCHFAHGLAELRTPTGRVEGEAGNSASAILTKPTLSSNSLSQTVSGNVASVIGEGQSKKCLLKLKGPKKINRIYGDWLDDLPLLQNFTSQVES